MERRLGDDSNKRTRDLLETVALHVVVVVVGCALVAGYVWLVPLPVRLRAEENCIPPSKQGPWCHLTNKKPRPDDWYRTTGRGLSLRDVQT